MLANAFQYAREQRIAVVAPDFPNLKKSNPLVTSTDLRRFIGTLVNQSTGAFFFITTAPEYADDLAQRMRFTKIFKV